MITSSRRSAVVLRNASPAENGHVAVLLRGTTGNRDAVGARVTVTAAGRSQVAEVVCGRGYQGHFGTRLSFGIGAADGVERIVVQWPGGKTTVIDDPPHGCTLVIRETGQWFVAAPVRHAK